MSKERPSFSIIIPFKNAASTLQRCIDSLFRLEGAPIECIFVDNNSTDRSVAIIEAFKKQHPQFPLLLLSETKPGAAAARNTGVKASSKIWLAFTDSDCIVESRWIDDFTRAISDHPECSAFAGCIRGASTESTIGRFLGLFTLPPTLKERVHDAYRLIEGGYPTANLLIRKELFDTIGGFNEKTLTYGEDHELCSRIYASGNRLCALTGAHIYHIHRDSLQGLLKQSYAIGFSHGFCLKTLTSGAQIILLPWVSSVSFKKGRRVWIDGVQIDKKIAALLLAGSVFAPLLLAVPLYIGFTADKVFKRADAFRIPVSRYEALLMTGLLIVKSAVMTWGRVRSACHFGVICF
jgi:GT2 family glycosyltransferase